MGPTTHIRLAGIVRSLSYRDLTDGTNHHKAGWGVMLSGIAHPAPQVTTFASINYGHGYSSLGGDLQIGNYDMVPVPGQKADYTLRHPWDGVQACSTTSAPTFLQAHQ